jgi:hypothetical protein
MVDNVIIIDEEFFVAKLWTLWQTEIGYAKLGFSHRQMRLFNANKLEGGHLQDQK